MFRDIFNFLVFESLHIMFLIFLIGIAISIILWILDYFITDKRILNKIRIFRVVLLLYIPTIWGFCFLGCGIGECASLVNDLDYSYPYENTQEIKRMDYNIHIREDGSLHVNHIIEVEFDSDYFSFDFSEIRFWEQNQEEIVERNFKIKDVISR